jgi:hypothetical protein
MKHSGRATTAHMPLLIVSLIMLLQVSTRHVTCCVTLLAV